MRSMNWKILRKPYTCTRMSRWSSQPSHPRNYLPEVRKSKNSYRKWKTLKSRWRLLLLSHRLSMPLMLLRTKRTWKNRHYCRERNGVKTESTQILADWMKDKYWHNRRKCCKTRTNTWMKSEALSRIYATRTKTSRRKWPIRTRCSKGSTTTSIATKKRWWR